MRFGVSDALRVHWLLRWCRGWLHWNRRLRDIANFVVPSSFSFVMAFRHGEPVLAATMWHPASGQRSAQRAELDCLEVYVEKYVAMERDRLDALDEPKGFYAMPEPRWTEIYARPPVWSPPVRRLETPEIPAPRCPEHCVGHAVEARLVCPRCGGPGGVVLAHRWPHDPGMFWYSEVTTDGTPLVVPECRDCGQGWRRR